MSALYLHPEHGVNPTCGVCFWCGKDDGTVVLLGRAYKGRAPHRMVVSLEPCATCRADRAKGVTIIEASDTPIVHKGNEGATALSIKAEGGRDAYPTGRWCVMTEAAAARMFNVPVPPEKVFLMDVETYTACGFAKYVDEDKGVRDPGPPSKFE